jgi:hypothetical protein
VAMRVASFVGVAVMVCLAMVSGAYGQEQGRGAPQQPQTAKAAAAFDMTGYWVAMVTEDWRFRMITPLKGDYLGVPLNAEGRRVADSWDPAKDEVAGEQCRSYGAANVMRVPARLRIAWQDDQTMKMETDAGTQTRVFYFGAPQGQGGDRQGVSGAAWEFDAGFGARAANFDPRFGSLGGGGGGGRESEGGHDKTQTRLPSQERHPVQRQRGGDRILRSGHRAEWRHLPGGYHHG